MEKHWCFEMSRDFLCISFALVRPPIMYTIWKASFYQFTMSEFWALEWPVIISGISCNAILDILNIIWLKMYLSGKYYKLQSWLSHATALLARSAKPHQNSLAHARIRKNVLAHRKL